MSAETKSFAIPMPASPAPKNSTRWSRRAFTRNAQSAEDARERNGGRTLDVIIKSADPLLISFQQAKGILVAEVFELNQQLRKESWSRLR